MDLFWVIYFADISNGIKATLSIVTLLLGFAFLSKFLFYLHESNMGDWRKEQQEKEQDSKNLKRAARLLLIPTVLVLIIPFVPSEKAIYMMAGVEAAQRIAERPETQEIGGKILRLVNQKLDDVLDESPQSQGKTKSEIIQR